MYDNIAKKHSKSLVIPTGRITDCMAFKCFEILKVDCFEETLNRIKIDGIVNDDLNSCNS